MMMRVFAFVAAFLVAAFPAGVRAQTAPSELEVRVVDASGAAVADARVFVSGPVITSVLTPRDGVVRFNDADSGVYGVRVERAGYEGVNVANVEVLPGRRRIVTVTLTTARPHAAASPAPGTDGLTVIGRVSAHSSASTSSVDVDEGSPLRRVSEDLSQALAKIGGVTIDQPAAGGTLTISLRNADPSRTIASAGGTPLLGGAAPQLQQVASDLSTGASVGAGGAGAIGGGVNFRTLEPTRTWQGQLSTQYGSYDHAVTSFALSGGRGKLGIALQHAERTESDTLTGLRFTDTSGETYVHDGAARRIGDFAKLRYAVSPKITLLASYLSGTYWSSAICHEDVTNLPCGYGPGNANYGVSHSLSAGAQAQVGHVTLSGSVFGNGYTSTVDDRGLVVGNVSEPFTSTTRGSGRGWYGYASVGVKRHTLYLAGSSFTGRSETVGQGAFQTPSSLLYRHGYVALDDDIKLSDRWSADASLGTVSSTSGSNGSAGLSVTLRPSRFETINARVGVSGSSSAYEQLGSFGDPARATYDCGTGTVRVSGPNAPPGSGTTSIAEVTYDRRGKRGTLRVTGFERVERNALVQAQFPLQALGPQVPDGYVGAIGAIWNQAAICGGVPFDASRVYVAEAITGPTVRYRGVEASGRLALGRAVIAIPSYSISGAALASNDPRLVRPGSPYAVGAQLPFRPLHGANVLLDAQQPRANLEYMLDARWSSANNSQGLGSYLIVAAGVSWQARYGRLTLLANNLFNTDTGLFATNEFAQPLALAGGGSYVPVPTLLPPRSITLLYSVRAGRMR